MNFDNHVFRCHSLGKLMTAPRNKSESLSETAKSYLVEVYAQAVYSRKKDVTSKYLEKGVACEEDGITLYSRVKKMFFVKNEQRVKNGWLSGEVDLHNGKSLQDCTIIYDIKNAWDIHTFLKVEKDGISDLYDWQGQAYMYLAGPQCQTFTLVYTLVDAPGWLIEHERRKLRYSFAPDSIEYVDASAELDLMMTFQDIPLNERVIEITVARDDEKISRIAPQLVKCRQWLNDFHKQRESKKL